MRKSISTFVVIVMIFGGAFTVSVAAAGGETTINPMNPPIVEVSGGKLRGYVEDTTFAFAGIPYATAERFEQPKPIEPWTGIKDAQIYGPVAPTAERAAISRDEFVWPHRYWTADENCQNLNIWTQHLDSAAKKPVMVWIHGGAFYDGSSIEAYAYEGKNLSEFGDVVVVSLNHRLNVLGCLNLSAYGEEYKNSANTGMADIVMALQWVQENIASFGGDPENVTIFGQSGGSGKVVNLMWMPAAEGLFHKAIAESSGTPTNLYVDESLRATEVLMENLNLDGTQLDVLKTMPYHDLLTAADAALAQVAKELNKRLSWRPLIDESYLLSDYCDFAAEIPFMVGHTFSEGQSSLYYEGEIHKNEWTPEQTYANLTELYGADKVDAIISEFTRIWPDKTLADLYFYHATHRNRVKEALDRKMKSATAPVYKYLFAYELPVNGGVTAFHCAELTFVFHNVDVPQCRRATGNSQASYALQDVVSRAWVNFAATGNPRQEGLEWPPYDETDGTMIFDVNSRFTVLDNQKLVDLILSK